MPLARMSRRRVSISLRDHTLGERVLISGLGTCSCRLDNVGPNKGQQAPVRLQNSGLIHSANGMQETNWTLALSRRVSPPSGRIRRKGSHLISSSKRTPKKTESKNPWEYLEDTVFSNM